MWYNYCGDYMIKYINQNELEKVLNNNNKLIMVFGKGLNCSVCHAVEDRINKTYPNKFKDLDIYYLTVEENANFRGQYLIFTTPTILLFDGNKEVHRESRIIDFNRMERILNLYYS